MTANVEMGVMEIEAQQTATRVNIPKMSAEEFYNFCVANPDLRVEREKDGKITIMSPVNLKSSFHEAELIAELRNWNRKHRLGKCFSPSAGFTLPDTSVKAADVAWLSKKTWDSLPESERNRFGHAVPDFIAEVRSYSDSLKKLKTKVTESWLANGVKLAWLIDPLKHKSYVFRQNGTEEVVEGFDKKLSGEDVLPGFEFDLSLLLED
ncbi:MAG: Uma2 family endonuclease [Saprospiraceae bacterium]|jgi:Uma2 family endonuclease|nr:Uma2 family endonuclease [Saprospiraceae bacterium]